jgi:hypothetical protein
MPAGAKGMAAPQPFEGEEPALDYAVALDSLSGVSGAAREEATRSRK